MLGEHKELQAAIEIAEEGARVLFDKGARVDEAVRLLRAAGKIVKDRIRMYEQDLAAKAAGATKPKPVASGSPAPGARTSGSASAPETGDSEK
jgi:hypothetical protein